ncbi:Uncharacterised protein [Mycobacteroides abscessus subsp. massiliense]|nr:Uncharacterised protein [Mycobacteroides abscessus subsp. massiliense]
MLCICASVPQIVLTCGRSNTRFTFVRTICIPTPTPVPLFLFRSFALSSPIIAVVRRLAATRLMTACAISSWPLLFRAGEIHWACLIVVSAPRAVATARGA